MTEGQTRARQRGLCAEARKARTGLPWRTLLPIFAVSAAAGCGQAGPPPEGDGTEGTTTFSEGLLAILVVHGGPMLDHGYLAPNLEPLAEDHTLVFFDQRLSGRSAGVVDSASVRMETLVEDMEALRSALGMEEMSILAHHLPTFRESNDEVVEIEARGCRAA